MYTHTYIHSRVRKRVRVYTSIYISHRFMRATSACGSPSSAPTTACSSNDGTRCSVACSRADGKRDAPRALLSCPALSSLGVVSAARAARSRARPCDRYSACSVTCSCSTLGGALLPPTTAPCSSPGAAHPAREEPDPPAAESLTDRWMPSRGVVDVVEEPGPPAAESGGSCASAGVCCDICGWDKGASSADLPLGLSTCVCVCECVCVCVYVCVCECVCV